jgi:hypothetical protein
MTDRDEPDLVARLERVRRIAEAWTDRNEDARTIAAELDALIADVREERDERSLEHAELAESVIGIRDRLPASPRARTDRDTLAVVANLLSG